jgi:hypothetical protein
MSYIEDHRMVDEFTSDIDFALKTQIAAYDLRQYLGSSVKVSHCEFKNPCEEIVLEAMTSNIAAEVDKILLAEVEAIVSASKKKDAEQAGKQLAEAYLKDVEDVFNSAKK